ncbi:MAG: glycosyltransferase family 2 protein [Aliishimia sp.]
MTFSPQHSDAAPLNRISVIIVNYGTPALTIAGVQSVLTRDHGGRSVDIHVLDNGSADDSASLLQAAHNDQNWGARVTLYLETENHGFGRGNNLVVQALEAQNPAPDAVFLLNPDAALENEAIDLLATALDGDPKAGFAGAGISKPEGGPVAAAFRFPSPASEFSGALSFGPVARLLKPWSVPLPPDHPAGPVDWVAGAAILMRMSTLRDLNNFDPGFFLYYEEVDLMRRGHAAGWKSLYVPHARVTHIEGEATGVKSDRAIAARFPSYRYHSWQYYFRKNHGRGGAMLAAAARLLGSAGNHIISKLRRRPSSVPEAFFGDFWRYAMRPLLRRGSGV